MAGTLKCALLSKVAYTLSRGSPLPFGSTLLLELALWLHVQTVMVYMYCIPEGSESLDLAFRQASTVPLTLRLCFVCVGGPAVPNLFQRLTWRGHCDDSFMALVASLL